MSNHRSDIGIGTALQWKTYSVSKAQKAPLLAFVIEALEMHGCRILFCGDASIAPFYIVFESQSGERQGILVYAFYSNQKLTKNRPADEHRFQIKYGNNLKGVLEVATDPHLLITTLFLGIDYKQNIFVSLDPLMNNPAPMSRSVEFKSRDVDVVREEGWAAWERDRRPAKTTNRPAADLEDTRTEVLVGGTKNRLLDLILFERLARGLDPGERHLVADKMARLSPASSGVSHALLDEFGIEHDALFNLIEGASRLKMAVRGWVAEQHLFDALTAMPEVSECVRLEVDSQPDISLRWKGSAPLLLECKNSLRTKYADGRPKVDFQKTRAAKGNPCSRYYQPSDFSVLAACLHAVSEKWEFRYALTSDLDPHKTCAGRISSTIAVAEPIFTDRPAALFDRLAGI